MRVSLTKLGDSPVHRLEVEDVRHSDARVGDVVGYICGECQQSDETRQQIWHDADCPLAGEHGRAHYDVLEPDVPGRPTPEFDPDHRIDVVYAAHGHRGIGIGGGEVLAFRCECGNLDEDVFEVVHDSGCDLADDDCARLTDADVVPDGVATDGGRP